MAPTSRIILTRHAQADHNVTQDYDGFPDAALTALGKRQAAALSTQVKDLCQEVDLIVTSPLKRTLQTTKLGWKDAIDRLGGLSQVICLPQAQECNAFPCDTGSSKATLESDPELAGFDFSPLTPDWNSKKGFWAPDREVIANRATWVRQWLRERPEETIVLVAHGDILTHITASAKGPSQWGWRNAEARIFTFDPDTVHRDECYLYQEKGKEVAVAGGYSFTSSEAEQELNGNL